jgi:hypothetical protein
VLLTSYRQLVSDGSRTTPSRGVPPGAVDPGGVVSAAVPLIVDEACRAIVASSSVAFGAARLYGALLQPFGRDVRVFRTAREVEVWRQAVGMPALYALLPSGDRRRTPDRRWPVA